MQWNEFRTHVRHLPSHDQKQVERSFELGERLHRDQRRQSGEAYFSHPIAVADMLADMGADADTIIAALLHDAVEDTPLTLQQIGNEFNGAVATLIDGVTKLKKAELPEKPTLNERIETFRKIFTLMQKDVRIMVIKLFDRLHNMQTVSFLSREKQQALAKETMDVYAKIADRLCMQDLRDELVEHCLVVLEPHLLRQLQVLLEKNEAEGRVIARMMRDAIQEIAPPGMTIDTRFERKSWERLRQQHEAGGATVTGLSTHTVVFVTNTVDECYQVMGYLHQLWQREILSFQDFINQPGINGYQGLHTTVILEGGARMRCKIRTVAMQRYARKGIASVCFSKEASGIMEHLPWTQRISPLSENTTERSEEFWQSLQSDILGESIVIHGPGDQTVLLPKGATALDGVFYLYGTKGWHTKDICINGKSIPFNEDLSNACSMTATFAAAPLVQLPWLQYVRTGIGSAMVRQGLAQQEKQTKIASGKGVLQEYFHTRRRGFISEFDQGSLERALREQGLGTLEDMYTQLAEGRAIPQDIEGALFERTHAERRHTQPRHLYLLTCRLPATNRRTLLEILQYYQVKSAQINDRSDWLSYRIKLFLTEEERKTLIFSLRQTLNESQWDLALPLPLYRTVGGIVLLFLLWGLDPVVAKKLIDLYALSPIDLTIVRFWSLSAMGAVLLLWAKWHQRLPETPLPLKSKSLWFSVGLMLCVALTTYTSLQTTEPAYYTIPMTAAGVLLTSIVNRHRWHVLVMTWTLLLTGVALPILFTPSWPLRGVVYTLLAVTSFSVFCVISERYKREEELDVRAAQYFFVLSILCAALTIPLIPLTSIMEISSPVLLYMVLFSIFLAGLPYYIYYYLLSRREIDYVLRFSFCIIAVTVLGQMILIGPISVLTVTSALLVSLGAVLPLVKPRLRTHLTWVAGRSSVQPSSAFALPL